MHSPSALRARVFEPHRCLKMLFVLYILAGIVPGAGCDIHDTDIGIGVVLGVASETDLIATYIRTTSAKLGHLTLGLGGPGSPLEPMPVSHTTSMLPSCRETEKLRHNNSVSLDHR
jgi:hypothetical protein